MVSLFWCHGATTGGTNVNDINDRDRYLKHLNKLSHNISKPSTNASPIIKKASFDHTHPPQQPPPSEPHLHNQNQSSLQAQQHQPPVYNINKNDFRDVVQKLTGSPAHERLSAPPIYQPKPQSSRLQRIRPPPLAHVSNRPAAAASMTDSAVPNMNPPGCSQPTLPINGPVSNSFIQRPQAGPPLSPLPPFPAVHAAAESPVSAYLRYFQSSMPFTVDSNPKQFPPLVPLISPRWNNLSAPQQQQQQQPPPQKPQQQHPPQVSSTGINQSQLSSSSLPFGCLNSPRSPSFIFPKCSIFSKFGSIRIPAVTNGASAESKMARPLINFKFR
ncbi:VQ motif-containing protein 9 [Hibiscus syriacus]|uniref:VQ motif-containing protein 9 n=1 Tax=Hibiscus syriacus TaxID=106335 RepID=A0A6A2WXU3_HIBSY|nr:VQ motif-containing protein 9 [Hibiscus syriacus]